MPRQYFCNYGPISNLSFFAKIYEQLLYKYLFDFFYANTTMYKHQFGFREKHSTHQEIISLVEKITESWDTGDIVIGVFLDLKRAFDTVSHDIPSTKENVCLWNQRQCI